MPRAFQRTFSVQGLNILDKGQEWDDAANAHTTNIKVVLGDDAGQPTYPVVFLIDNEFVGYPPEQIADEIADVMEQGWPIELRILEADSFNEDWSHTEKEDGEEYPRIYATAKVQVYAIPPDPTEKQIETFSGIKREREEQHEAWKERYAKWQEEEEARKTEAIKAFRKQQAKEQRKTNIQMVVLAAVIAIFIAPILFMCSAFL